MLLRSARPRSYSAIWPPCHRHLSLANALVQHRLPRHPAYSGLATALQDLPHFRARGEDVEILHEPKDFYQTLLRRISGARRRIFIASLYIGKEERELISALHDALKRNAALRVVILVDYLRSTRETPRPSSASLVASLAAKFPSQVDLRLYHTPNLAGWKKKLIPRRFDEGWGLQHMKCYGFDDDVLMSGANLSNDYFTNRQDRYIEFRCHAPLADYFASLLEKASSYSFRALATDTTTEHPAMDIVWPDTNPCTSFLDKPSKIPAFKAQAHDAFTELTIRWARKPLSALSSALPPSSSSRAKDRPRHDTSLRPVLQMGPFDITQETELALPSIFETANCLATAPGGAETKIDWTSGYFSVQERYKDMALSSKARVRMVSASPEANGFTGSRGVSKYIPPAYTHLQHVFYDQAIARAKKRRRDSHISLSEWKRKGWTYHAKGVWLSPSHTSPLRLPADHSPFADADDLYTDIRLHHPLPPNLTLIGSSNYGRRSASRDLEANVLVTTENVDLQHRLKRELDGIREYATDQVNQALFERKSRRVPLGVKLAAKAIEDML